MQSVKLKGFAPDLDPLTPGIFASCENIIPTIRGFAPLESPASVAPALPRACKGAFFARLIDGTSRFIAGTRDRLYVYRNGVLDPSMGGQDLSKSTLPWRFTQFGDWTIACNGVDPVQVLKKAADEFVPLAGNPLKATIVEATNYFVFAFARWGQRHEWACSGIGNAEHWTPDLSSQATSGYLTATPGPILAARKIGDGIAVYKLRGTYLGQYVGPPVNWAFQLISPQAGAVSQEALVVCEDGHYFVGETEFYAFDGGGPPRPIPCPLRDWFFLTELDPDYRGNIAGWWDHERDIIFWHYPPLGASGNLTRWIAWNRRSNSWTQGSMNVEAVARIEIPNPVGPTYDELGNFISTFGQAGNRSYEDEDITGKVDLANAVFLNDHALYALTGTPTISSFTTSDLGDAQNYYMVRRLRPQFAKWPTDPVTVQMFRKEKLGAELRTGLSSLLDFKSGWVNVRQSARLHRAQFTFSGRYEIQSFDYDATPAGTR